MEPKTYDEIQAMSDEEHAAWAKRNRESVRWTRLFAFILVFIGAVPISAIVLANRTMEPIQSAGIGIVVLSIGFGLIVFLGEKVKLFDWLNTANKND